MVIRMEEIGKYVGKPVSDTYGRNIGRLIGLTTNARDEIVSVAFELANGKLLQCPSSQILMKGDSVVLTPSWRIEAIQIQKEFELATRRVRALDELNKSGDLQGDIYTNLKKQHESVVEEAKGRRQGLISSLEERLADLNSQVRDLQTLLANNKMLHTSREIDDSAYQIASEAIRSGLERTLTEKKDIEEVVDHLSKLETSAEVSYQPPEASPTPAPEKPKESRDVIVVHVKEKM